MVDHLSRRESGKMVAVLTRLFGAHNLELAEDVVQDTFHQALKDWTEGNLPDNPTGWLMTVAKRKAINFVRREKYAQEFAVDMDPFLKSEWSLASTVEQVFLENEINDSQLRMIFTCCHPDLSRESQLALTLKTLCGFSIREVANAFLTNEETINKRLYRAREKIRDKKIRFEVPSGKALQGRLEAVHLAAYLLFNEGYNSSTDNLVIRKDLCAEAIRLTSLLTEKPIDPHPNTFALLALMCFHAARFESRIDNKGCIIILEEQDRSKWDKKLIHRGMDFLFKASGGDVLSAYHLEASIAAEHCMTESFAATNWQNLYFLYDKLSQFKSSPIIALNKSIIIGKMEGPAKAIALLEKLEEDKKLSSYYLLHASLGEFYLQIGEKEKAKARFKKAQILTNSIKESELLDRKMMACYS